jgi:hypothetical protein
VDPLQSLFNPPLSPRDLRRGNETIRIVRPLVNPFFGILGSFFEGAARAAGKQRTGAGPKARKACLGGNSRQDGGRLVERSGNPAPGTWLVNEGDAVKHHREGAGKFSTLHRRVWWQFEQQTIPHVGGFAQ